MTQEANDPPVAEGGEQAMGADDDSAVQEVLNWCRAVLGPVEVASDRSRDHAGQRASVCRLRTRWGNAYVKIHRDPSHWESEVHAYERWAPVFGGTAPRLLAVRDEEPLALVISELQGTSMEQAQLSAPQERAVWRAAGRALATLHELDTGACFGPCRRDGTCAGTPTGDAREHVLAGFDEWEVRGLRAGCLSDDELAIVRAVRDLVPAFVGERPIPCHRDYCPANWLVTDDGAWAGVIDFEFSGWDVRVADLARYPEWEWMTRPDLIDAFLEGYGRAFTPAEEQQRLVALAQYALGAIVWGEENAYYGYAREGRQALRHLARLLG